MNLGKDITAGQRPAVLGYIGQNNVLYLQHLGYQSKSRVSATGRYYPDGSYAPKKYKEKYQVSCLGGADKEYEEGRLGVGLAYTDNIAAKELHTNLSFKNFLYSCKRSDQYRFVFLGVYTSGYAP